MFDKPLDNLPKNLKTLILGQDFEHVIDYLPDSLITLDLSQVRKPPPLGMPLFLIL